MKEGRHFMAPLLPTTSHGQPHPRYRHAMTGAGVLHIS